MAKLRKCNFIQFLPSYVQGEGFKEGYFHQFGEMRLIPKDRPETYAIVENLEGTVHWVKIEDITFPNPPNPEDIE